MKRSSTFKRASSRYCDSVMTSATLRKSGSGSFFVVISRFR
jgi:hypothetical protein